VAGWARGSIGMNYHDDMEAGRRWAESCRWWRRAAIITWSIFVLFWVVLIAFAWWSTH
jgi:hypothetical protein